jgi:hypothetical protein
LGHGPFSVGVSVSVSSTGVSVSVSSTGVIRGFRPKIIGRIQIQVQIVVPEVDGGDWLVLRFLILESDGVACVARSGDVERV